MKIVNPMCLIRMPNMTFLGELKENHFLSLELEAIRFKHLWCALVLASLCATKAFGASLDYEGFDYPPATPLVGLNGGSGFAVPWVADPGVIVQPPGLSMAVALPSTGLSIGGSFNAARQLTSPLNETEYWASFQIQANPGNDQVYLGLDVIPSTTPQVSFGRILNTYFIRQGSSTSVQAGVVSAPGVTDLLVARFRQSGAITLVALWVNTANFAAPPLLVLVVPTIPYTWVNLQVQPGFLADEVRIGTTPGDVAASLGFSAAGTNLTLSWPQGTLLQAPTVNGPWTTNGASSPYTTPMTNPQQYYRVILP